MKRKRTGFAIGIMLLMGGWGLTWYVHEQQQIVGAADSTRRMTLWKDGRIRIPTVYELETIPSRYIYATGIMLMVIGAGVTAFTLPLPESWK